MTFSISSSLVKVVCLFLSSWGVSKIVLLVWEEQRIFCIDRSIELIAFPLPNEKRTFCPEKVASVGS